MPNGLTRYRALRLSTVCLTLLSTACVSRPERGAHPSGETARPVSSAPRVLEVSAKHASRAPDEAAQGFDPPARLRLPGVLQAGERVPLLLLLHGFGVPASLLVAKAGLDQLADQKRFAYLAPEGSRNARGQPFWNAGPSCCDLDHQQTDDEGRLRDLLDENLKIGSIDRNRVFVIGYSNGAFMAQRLACAVGDRLAGVISVAGASPDPALPCAQGTPLSFLEIHGDADPVVHYAGGTVFDRTDVAPHSSTPETAKFWAQRLSCAGELSDPQGLDLEPQLPGRETSIQRYANCHGSVELWTVRGGGHYVALQPPAFEAMWNFIVIHPKSGG